MLTQSMFDQLSQLRLPGFRAALEEQLHNPHYADPRLLQSLLTR